MLGKQVATTLADRPAQFDVAASRIAFSALTETFFAENVTRTTNKEG